jgi:hypothetical protein
MRLGQNSSSDDRYSAASKIAWSSAGKVREPRATPKRLRFSENPGHA